MHNVRKTHQKHKNKTLPNISPLLGQKVRTNSETLIPVSTRKRDDDGKLIAVQDVKVGDIVLTSKYGGTDVKFDDREYKILNVSDILAIVG